MTKRSQMSLLATIAVAGLITTACGGTSSAPGASRTAVSEPPQPASDHSTFLIGTWEQPISSAQHPNGTNFEYWKSLGINTLVEIPQTGELNATTAAQWDSAACAAGLSEMRQPINGDPMRDTSGRNSPCMIAWNLPDEPDLPSIPGVSMTPAAIAAEKQKDNAANPGRPVYLSLVGLRVLASSLRPTERPYGAVLGQSDWLSADDYPVDAGRATPVQIIGRELEGLAVVGPATANRMVFIETGHVGNRRTPITPEQMRAEIWTAVVHGARGIVYFSDTAPAQGQGGPSTYDNTTTTAGMPAMMSSQNTLLTSLAGVLVGPRDPGSFGATASAAAGGGPVVETGWRTGPSGEKYVIVVNTGGAAGTVTLTFRGIAGTGSASVVSENRTITIDSRGVASDTFAPYAVHIYRLR